MSHQIEMVSLEELVSNTHQYGAVARWGKIDKKLHFA